MPSQTKLNGHRRLNSSIPSPKYLYLQNLISVQIRQNRHFQSSKQTENNWKTVFQKQWKMTQLPKLCHYTVKLTLSFTNYTNLSKTG